MPEGLIAIYVAASAGVLTKTVLFPGSRRSTTASVVTVHALANLVIAPYVAGHVLGLSQLLPAFVLGLSLDAFLMALRRCGYGMASQIRIGRMEDP